MGFFYVVIKGKNYDVSHNVVEMSKKIIPTFDLFSTSETKQNEFYFIQKFRRMNGSGADVCDDATSGSWLIVTGTWFHESGLCSGKEKALLRLICEKGLSYVVKGLDGFFTVVFWDGISNEIKIVTDVIGSCYSFIRIINDCVIVSNSSYFLANLGKVSLDVEAFQEFLHLGVIYGRKTFFNEVSRSEFSSIISIKNANIYSDKYWKASDIDVIVESMDSAVEKFDSCLSYCVNKCSELKNNVVIDLTSGLDSRVLVTGFINNSSNFSTNVVGDLLAKDVVISQELANLFSIPHHHIVTDNVVTYSHLKSLLWLTDGEFDLFEYSKIYKTHSALSGQFNIIFNGSFGELARGYWWELLAPKIGKYEKIDSLMLCKKRFAAQLGPVELNALTRYDLYERLVLEIDKLLAPVADRPNTFQMDYIYLYMRMRCWQGRIASATNKIWPCFSPFMLRPMLELLLEIQPHIKQKDHLYKNFLAKANPSWAKHRTEFGGPAEPLTVKNMFRFLPVPYNLARKSVHKIRSKMGIGKKSSALLRNYNMRQELFHDKNFKDLINIDYMLSGTMLNSNHLENFIKNSFSPNFEHQIFLQRLITYEIAMRTIEVS